jgi:ribulose-phosphate 3-epimerase
VRDLRLAPSILSADFAQLGAEVADVAPAIEWVHVDVMDGHYVPNITLGPPVVKSLRAATDRKLDCHLMITAPEVYAPQLLALGAESVTFHPEVCADPLALIHTLHDQGGLVGVAIKPAHPLAMVEELLPHIDMLLVMTVEPGFGGQSFMDSCVPKVTEAANWRATHNLNYSIQVDGGIALDTIGQAAQAGADFFVAGSAVFNAFDRVQAVHDLIAKAEHARSDRP